MAILQGPNGELSVPCRAVVGRSPLADIRLVSRRASSEHASIGWSNGRWTLRDLNSSNGTTVDGRPLLTRDRATLAAGNRLCFGGEDEAWLLTDASPPEPCAVLLGPQQYLWGQQSLLVLGADSAEGEPEASVYLEAERWRLDDGARVLSPECGDIVRLRTGYWRILLPDLGNGNHALTAGCDLDLGQLELRFQVRSGQLVTLIISQGSNQLRLHARAPLNTLFELATVRADALDEGWVSTFDLATKLKCSPEKVNVDVHRLRKLFQEAGVRHAARIVERDDAKRLRIGVNRIKFETQQQRDT